MGDTNSKTTTNSEFPPEFRPLAEGAVKQLLALQNAVPIAALANFAPAGTAGIAPMQQFAMDTMTPATFMTTPAQQGAFNAQAPVNAATMGMVGAGNETAAARDALASLQSSGRIGAPPQGADVFASFMQAMAQPSAPAPPRASSPPPTMTAAAAPSAAPANLPSFLPPVQQPASVFPGITPEILAQSWPKASTGAVPILGGPGPATINPSQPLSTDAFPSPFDKNDPEFQKLQLTGRENIVLDALVKGGMAHDKAYALVKGKGAAFGQAGNIAGITPEQALALVSGKGAKLGGGSSSGSKAPKKKEPTSPPKQDPLTDLNTGSA